MGIKILICRGGEDSEWTESLCVRAEERERGERKRESIAFVCLLLDEIGDAVRRKNSTFSVHL